MNTVKDELRSEIFWVLKALKKASFFASADDWFTFTIRNTNEVGAPDTHTQHNIFQYLVTEQVLEYKRVRPYIATMMSREEQNAAEALALNSFEVKLVQPRFNKLFKKYSRTATNHPEPVSSRVSVSGIPICSEHDNKGYFQFGTDGELIEVGRSNSQSFRLLRSLTEPFAVAKTVDSVFESIRESVRYKSKGGTYTNVMNNSRKAELIKSAFKELQRGGKLNGKLKLEFDEWKKKVWLELV